jgi:hypothetical protein
VPTREEILSAGIVQALNLDFLHPLGLQARVVSDSRIEIHNFENASGPILYGDEQLSAAESLAVRISYLRFKKTALLARATWLLKYKGLKDEDGLHQIVPGHYCRFCGCTRLAACVGPNNDRCSWIIDPDPASRMPGVCSNCYLSDEVLV